MIVLWNKYLTFFRVAGLNLRGGGAWTSAASVLNAFLLGEDPESGPERLYLSHLAREGLRNNQEELESFAEQKDLSLDKQSAMTEASPFRCGSYPFKRRKVSFLTFS